MEVIKGIPVAPGVVIGRAFVLDYVDERVPFRTVPPTEVDGQVQRFDAAVDAATTQLGELRDRAERELGREPAKIFGFHLGLLGDRSLLDPIRTRIRSEHVTAEYATASAFRSLAEQFRNMGNEVFQQKANDVLDLDRRLLEQLLGQSQIRLEHITEPVIIVAHELTPTQAASLDRDLVLALATDAGGRTSHTSIVARALNIPAVVGCQRVSLNINDGDEIIVDGDRGLVILRPDNETRTQYEAYRIEMVAYHTGLRKERSLDATTIDGVRIQLLGNIEFPEEIEELHAVGADGVGLYRTEFLYLTSKEEPSEEKLFTTYKACVELIRGKPITIRTLDLGADKYTQQQRIEPERNPFLGCRGIRYCLQNLPLFRRQLRAILRASAYGKLKLMFPLVTTTMELRQARMVMRDVMEELDESGIAFDSDIPIGVMIEVPSAAMMASAFARDVDFMSIGTNDLIQYTLAVDRGNERVANLYSAANPALLMLMKQVIRAGKKAGREVSVCGEMAGELTYTMLLLGFGLRTLSMASSLIPQVKRLVRSVDIGQCERLARKVGSFDSERQVLHYLRQQTRKILPEAFGGWTAD
ncbi:MAG: phosphoenolpyruvate--protein phosphotransferase [Phycisphaerales bacterium]